MGILNAKFDAEFESVGKKCKKVPEKKYRPKPFTL